jgi:hypothetical protein
LSNSAFIVLVPCDAVSQKSIDKLMVVERSKELFESGLY